MEPKTLAQMGDSTGIPLYTQLHSLLLKRLEAGEWPVGSQMPTLDALMEEYGVSRVTVREAMARLEREGIISRSRGKGTHVLRDLSRDRWLVVPSTWDELVTHISTLSARVDELRSGFVMLAPGAVRGRVAGEFWQAQRVNLTGAGKPYSVTVVSLAADIFRRDPEGFGTGAVLPLLARMQGVVLAEAWQSLTISTADLDTARLLAIDVGAPVAQVRREASDPSGRLVYLADVIYPARSMRLDTRLI